MLYRIIRKLRSIDERLRMKCGLGKKMSLSTTDLFYMQHDGNTLTRYDVVVRYMVARAFLSGSTQEQQIALDMYARMQNARIGSGYAETAVPRFKSLIASYTQGGYDASSLIILDKNLHLIDGSHRLAMGLFLGLKHINALVLNLEKRPDYSLDWFFSHGFSDSDIDSILSVEREIKAKFNDNFLCVIWPPAVSYSSDIIKDLSRYGIVTDIRKYRYRAKEFANVVKAIYAVDNIAGWKIEKKLEHMHEYEPELVSVQLKVEDPRFRIKTVNHQPISQVCEHLKIAIRGRYKSCVKNYFMDIILHTGDNYMQSSYMKHVLEPGIDGRKILKCMEGLKYALAKTDVPYWPTEFPDRIPVGKDLDVFVRSQDYELLKERQIKLAHSYKDYDIEVRDNDHGSHIRYNLENHLIFQVDISYNISTLNNSFVDDAISARVASTFADTEAYILSPKYEYIYRMHEYNTNNSKKHHKQYLEEHLPDYDAKLADKYILNSFIKNIK